MSDPIRWETKGGHVRWQPRRYDGTVLVWLCAMGSCITFWYTEESAIEHGKKPVTYWWRWLAALRGRIGDFWERRRLNREWVTE